MSHWDIRSFWRNRRLEAGRVRHAARGRAGDLAGVAGAASLPGSGYTRPRLERSPRQGWAMEALENRVLLSGDHPSFNQVFGVQGAVPTIVDVSSGQGEATGRIGFNNDDDMFQFTTLDDDFVTLQVDTFNDTVSSLDSLVRVFDTSGTELFTGNDNTLSPTRVTDGWLGFFAPAGTYYVQVRSNFGSGTKATGDYTLRADVATDLVDVTTGEGSATGAVVRPTADQVFRVDVTNQDFISLLADTLATDFGGTDTDLNTKVAVYNPDGELLASASGNGVLTGSATITPTDAWVGFLADPGTYYIRVLSDRANATFGTGAFTVYADVQTDEITPDPNTGVGTAAGTLTRLGQDFVYRIEMPDTAPFDSLVTVLGGADPLVMDTHLDIYDASGAPITSDSTTGNSTNAFAVVPGGRGAVLYVRIRSDEIGNPAFRPSLGAYTVEIDGAATDAPLDPVTRIYSSNPLEFILNTNPTLFVFETLTAGTTIIAAFSAGMFPLPDPALTLYSADGEVIEFNDDLFGTNPQIDTELASGTRYFVLVEGFDNGSSGTVRLNIENVTIDPTVAVDDHADRGDWINATPIQWADIGGVMHPGPGGFARAGNLPVGYSRTGPLDDHSLVVYGYTNGRIYANGDSDVFMVVPQVDMWGQFEGQEALNRLTADPLIPGVVTNEHGIRPASRLQILVRGHIDGTLTPTINVWRSDVLSSPGTAVPIATNNGVLVAAGGPWLGANWRAGFVDPAAFEPTLSIPVGDPIQYLTGEPNGLEVWGGEPYFIEIVGGATGTYEILVVGDAAPNEVDTIRQDQISEIREIYGKEPGESGFTASLLHEIPFGTSPGGEGVPPLGPDALFHSSLVPSAAIERVFFYGEVQPPQITAPLPGPINQNPNPYGPPSPNFARPLDPPSPFTYGGATVLRETTLPSIERVDDKDTFFFRATSTGTTEIRLNTTSLTNVFNEYISSGLNNLTPEDPMEPLPDANYSEFTVPEDRATYNSLLDGTLRIYNADFEQIAFNDDSGVVRGDSQVQAFGELGSFTFQKRDPRVVFDVVEGEVYYVIVESAQRYIDGTPQNIADRIYATEDGTATGELDNQYADWRFATGTYQLLVNSMPQEALGAAPPTQLASGDDHIDFLSPVVSGPAAFAAVAAQATVLLVQPNGEINANTFMPTSGLDYAGTITTRGVTRDTDMFTFVAAASGTFVINLARPTGSTVIPAFDVTDVAGNVLTGGTGSSLGTISGTFDVTQGQRYFIAVGGGGGSQGRYTLDLVGPDPADDHADVGQFQDATSLNIQDFLGGGNQPGRLENPGDTDVFTFQAFTTQDVTVTFVPTGALDGVVEIYEIQEDLLGQPVLRRIGRADSTTAYEVTFTMYRDRISSVSIDRRDQYFMVVSGANPNVESGQYRIEFEFEPTDDHADEAELFDAATRGLASLLLADTGTGTGDRQGEIEFFYDSDLFVYIAPAGGPAIFTAQPTGDATLQPRLSLYTSTGTLIATSDPFVTTPVTLQTNVVRGQAYYVVVAPSNFLFDPNGAPLDPDDIRLTGEYTVSVTGPAVDDHANLGEFDRATVVTLDQTTGNGAVGSSTPNAPGNPEIGPVIDTDLFRFSPLADGDTVVRVASVGASTVRPSITVFRQDGPGVYTQIASDSRTTPGAIQITIANANDTANYFVLVQDVFNSRAGEYRLTIDGEPGSGGNTDPAAVNFAMPDGTIALAERNGNGSVASSIDVIGDRDLFTFTALGSGPVFIQVVTADGSTLNASVTVLNAPNELAGSVVAFNSGGLPGVSAAVSFGGPGSGVVVNEGQQFWVIVDGIGTSVGGYRLRINGAPASFETQSGVDFRYRLYYPEGFANSNISEFIAIANPGTETANYRVVLYYQTGEAREVFRSEVNGGIRSIAPGARAGAQLSQQGVGARANVRAGVGYAIVVESDVPLAATVSHYDKGVTTGEAATRETSPTWYFPRVERDPGAVSDFITLYNPNAFSLNLTLTAYTTSGQQIVIERTGANALPGNRRGGFAIDNLDQLPIGTFAVSVSATPRNPVFNSSYVGIVAALTHFNEAETQGFGMVGDPNGGGTAGAIPEITRGNGVSSQVAIFNPGTVASTVLFQGSYISASLPDFSRSVQIAPGSVVFLTSKQLGLTNNQSAGLRFTSTLPVSILSSQVQRGDADATLAVTEAGTTAFFGDAFLTKAGAGTTYFETLSFYNPAASAVDVSVRILFTNGQSTLITVNVAANNFAALRLDQSTTLLNDPNRTGTFSIVTTASSPFAVTFSHYDLSFGGGWATTGAPFGLYNPISGIIA